MTVLAPRPVNTKVPRSAVRTRLDGRVQTAAHTYLNPRTKHLIVVVGTVHVGTRTYYAKLYDLVSKLQDVGAAVHYERIRKATEQEREALTDLERHVLDVFDAIQGAQHQIAETLGLIHQRAGMALHREWVNFDMTELELMRAVGVEGAPDDIPDFDELFDLMQSAPRWINRGVTGFFWTALRLLPVLHLITRLLPDVGGLGKWLDSRILLDDRNKIAVNAALDVPLGLPVVMIWGAGHLPGIGTLLVEQGYALIRTDWFTALSGLR